MEKFFKVYKKGDKVCYNFNEIYKKYDVYILCKIFYY